MKNNFKQDGFIARIGVIFFLSGFSALIYQVVWQRALTLYFGVGAVSTTIVVSVFLFGLGAGAYIGGWVSERFSLHKLYIYITLEALLGVIGASSLHVLLLVHPYLSQSTYISGTIIIAVLLIIPTVIMGMTLPIVVKITNGIRSNFGHTISLLYCVNTLGAAVGALLASYWLISFYGLQAAVYCAAAINFLIALFVYNLSFRVKLARGSAPGTVEGLSRTASNNDMDVAFFNTPQAAAIVLLSGFLAIGYQIIWFRIVGTLLKPSAYVFSTVLFVYLSGIALGSYWASIWLRRIHRKKSDIASIFFLINFAIALYVVFVFLIFYKNGDLKIAQWMINTSFSEQLHPPYNIRYAINSESTLQYLKSVYLLFDLLIWPFIFLFPATILMGAAYPILNVLVIRSSNKEGYGAGLIYALTIIGNVLGGLATGFLLLPTIGTEVALECFVLAGLLWFFGVKRLKTRDLSLGIRIFTVVASCLLANYTLPGQTQFYDFIHPKIAGTQRVITEGRDGVVVSIYGNDDHGAPFSKVYISGSMHASFPSSAFEVEALEAISHSKSVEHVLVIGFGGGNLTQAILRMPDVKSVTVVEIAETLIDNLKQIPMYDTIFADPRLHIEIDDGRRYLQRNMNRYDVIFMDPLQSTTAYSNNIYSKEFFELVRSHMNPNSILMTWMNEYSITPRTLAHVFPEMKCFYYFCLMSNEKIDVYPNKRSEFYASVSPAMRAQMDKRMNVDYYLKGDRKKILEMTSRYPLNTDLMPISEYYFGYTLKSY